MEQKSKLEFIQVLRFIAAMLVVLFHIHMHYRETSYNLLGDFFRLGSNGVDVFFVLSGFIIFYTLKGNYNKPTTFLFKRLFRILPSYWLILLIPTFISQIIGLSDKHPELFDFNHFINALFLTPNHLQIGPSWTLSYELIFYLIVFLALIFKQNGKYFFLLFSLPFLTLLEVIPIFEPIKFFQNPVSLEFLFGIVVFKLTDKYILPKNIAYLALVGAAAVFIISGLYLKFSFMDIPVLKSRSILFGIPAAVIIYSLICIEKQVKIKTPTFLLNLGAASYSLYLSHAILVSFIDKFAISWSDNAFIANCISLTGAVIAVIVSLLVYKYLELPVIQKLYQLLKTRPLVWTKEKATMLKPRIRSQNANPIN